MRLALIGLMAASVFVAIASLHRNRVSDRIARYLDPTIENRDRTQTLQVLRRPAIGWFAVGSFVGILVAQGDLFLAGPGRSVPALAVLGGLAGWVLHSARQTSLEEQRLRRLRFELPSVADAIAMHVVSGESVHLALERVVAESDGEVSLELAHALASSEADTTLAESLQDLASGSADPDAKRLYETLAHAHEVGGGLSRSLSELAVDFRAHLARDLTAEGGRRAVSTYGPVLALMVPTALVFLLYPTLLGLRSLSGGP